MARVVESTVGSIVKLQPAGVTMPTAAQALAEAQERIAPDYELDEDNYRDIDLDPDDWASAIDREIDRLMDGLLV